MSYLGNVHSFTMKIGCSKKIYVKGNVDIVIISPDSNNCNGNARNMEKSEMKRSGNDMKIQAEAEDEGRIKAKINFIKR